MEDALRCKNCNEPLKPHWTFCPYCKQPVQAQPKKCRKCGEELEDRMEICPVCGTNANETAQPKRCQFCGAELKEGVEKCPDCGKTEKEAEKAVRAATTGEKPAKTVERYKDQIFIKLKKLIAEKLGVDEEIVTMRASFEYDLGADSLDQYELAFAAEEEFDIISPDEEIEKLKTVKDAYEFIISQKK